MDSTRPMKRITVTAAKRIAEDYGYDQVIVIARRVGEGLKMPHGEHCTTYGVNKAHCDVAARCGDFLKAKVLGWIGGDSGLRALCPHGFDLRDNICGPCSEGRPTSLRPNQTP